MSSFPIFVADAFTDEAFCGNPAGVALLDEFPGDELLQKISAEINLSETAFLVKKNAGYDLRWFTPTTEVDLCGHATLASAHLLWEIGEVYKNSTIRFDTRSGPLFARLTKQGVNLDFPVTEVTEAQIPGKLADGLKIHDQPAVMKAGADYLVELPTQDDVLAVAPDFKTLAKVEMRGVIVTAKSNETDIDFVSRFFAPSAGINEDPVTGSAHCALASYWGEKLGKTEMTARQVSKRGGTLQISLDGDRVTLTGKAITTWRGEFLVR
ncbi:Phenazine biosynthesis protein PhzF like [hydrothermal vent metagenome]|uniref:Phenazine biosynthesis protein PhzF like n=1 Tax=hydrothermal vent metagenome TaxID=652676 RepID=A0A3B1C8F8_9ZZZZ